MSGAKASERPCKVRLCPSFAVAGHDYCASHKRFKKLDQISIGEKCRSCKRELRVGDYVTLLSTPGQNHHAVCPEKRKRAPRPEPASTPLFDSLPEGAHA